MLWSKVDLIMRIILESTYLSRDGQAARVCRVVIKLTSRQLLRLPFAPEVSTLIPPPKSFATFLLNVLLLTFRAPRTKMAHTAVVGTQRSIVEAAVRNVQFCEKTENATVQPRCCC